MEPVAAARNLHQTLYVARRTLASAGAGSDGLLAIRGEVVVLDDAGPVDVDVLQFERSAVAALAAGVEASLRDAADLYSGDLLPELPQAKRERFVARYAITPYDARVLTASRELADYFEAAASGAAGAAAKLAANWIAGALSARLNE